MRGWRVWLRRDVWRQGRKKLRQPLRTALLAAGPIIDPAAALAGPWTLPEDDQAVYLSFGFEQQSTDTDIFGDPAGGQRREVSGKIVSEFGVVDWLTGGFSVEGQWLSIDSEGASGVNYGLTSAGLHARFRVYDDAGDVGALQVAMRHTVERNPLLMPQLAETASYFELRGLWGSGFDSGVGHGWASAETGFRWRHGAKAHQAVLDGTLGLRPALAPDMMLIFQGFGVGPIGDGDQDETTLKLAPSVAYDVTDNIAVRLGVARDVLSDEEQPAATGLVDLWFRF